MQKTTFDDKNPMALAFLLGDALVSSELAVVADVLLKTTEGRFREDLKQASMAGDLSTVLKGLNFAQILQLVLLCTDEEILRALDEAVASGLIAVPPGEARETVINRYAASTFQVDVQLSRFGTRLRPGRKEVAALRLRRLVGLLYQMNVDSDVSELDWQLRGVEAGDIGARPEEFLRTSTPDQVLRRLVLARRTNMIAACAELGLDAHVDRSDEDLVGGLLWKLGFDVERSYLGTGRFWELHNGMVQMTSTAGVSALVDSEMIRGLASNYFVELEHVLDDTLAFAIWALTTDHVASHNPFQYRLDDERVEAFATLTAHASVIGAIDVSLGDKNTLHPLCRGFGILAEALDSYSKSSNDHKRDPGSFPDFAQHTTLKVFPFAHTVAFLDLSPYAKERLVETLRAVEKGLLESKAPELRNEQLHFRRTATDLEKLAIGLQRIGAAIQRLEAAGLARINFRLVERQGDEWGRQTLVLSDVHNRRIAFARPSSFDWLGLPSLSDEQHLLTEAVFAEPNEMLRFKSVPTSSYSELWRDFPLRRRRSETIAPVEFSGGSAPRATAAASQGVQHVKS